MLLIFFRYVSAGFRFDGTSLRCLNFSLNRDDTKGKVDYFFERKTDWFFAAVIFKQFCYLVNWKISPFPIEKSRWPRNFQLEFCWEMSKMDCFCTFEVQMNGFWMLQWTEIRVKEWKFRIIGNIGISCDERTVAWLLCHIG